MSKRNMFLIDEFIRKDSEKLENTEEYSIQGIYNYQGRINHSFGPIIVDPNGNFVGRIHDPDEHIVRVSAIKGKVENKADFFLMAFIKYYPDLILCPVYYSLSRSFKDGLGGEYVGGWSFDLRYRHLLSKNFNTAELVLSKK